MPEGSGGDKKAIANGRCANVRWQKHWGRNDYCAIGVRGWKKNNSRPTKIYVNYTIKALRNVNIFIDKPFNVSLFNQWPSNCILTG
jgi:hypothetical protein